MGRIITPRPILLCFFLVIATILAGLPTIGSAQTIFFTENFDNANFGARGWFDNTSGVTNIDTSVYHEGSASLRLSFAQGGSTPTGQYPKRHDISGNGTETLYLSFWIKFGAASPANWVGAPQASYHPHIIMVLSDADDPYSGPSQSFLDFYVEVGGPTGLTPRSLIQDALRIERTGQYPTNTPSPNSGLLGTSSPHAVAGGMGNQNATSNYFDYGGGQGFGNSTTWDAASASFVNNTWHHVEVYAAMNSVSGGVPQANGIIKYWVDGNLVINQTSVELRTAQYSNQKFKTFLLAPYMNPVSSKAQSFWIDNLIVADQPPGLTALPAPTNLRVVQ